MNIAMALQVQDIASQQIASVAHTIESVEAQLVRALNRFENGNAGDIANDNADEIPFGGTGLRCRRPLHSVGRTSRYCR